MAKAKTPSYVLELELQVNKRQRDFLERKCESQKQSTIPVWAKHSNV